MTRHFGHVDGQRVGQIYENREELSRHRVHGPPQGGIWGTPAEGASSIVLNGGYPDDADHGDLIIYTGHGGQKNRKQVADQRLDDSGNAALVRSELDGLPVRVIRGFNGDPIHSPTSGYRYDGLYQVLDHWSTTGVSGFLVWQFRLEKMTEDVDFTVFDTATPPSGNHTPRRRASTIQRTIRTTAVSEWVKRRHKHTCQVCGLSLITASGSGYAEGAHIRPLGRPHSGPDDTNNILCLCPNHHVLLDKGGITIEDDLTVRDQAGDTIGTLRTARGHRVDIQQLKYHRETWAPA